MASDDLNCVSDCRALGVRLGLERGDCLSLMCGVLHVNRSWLVAHSDDALSDENAARIRSAFSRRATGEPVAYIVGKKEFYGLELAVDTRVLIPRPETEMLVDFARENVALDGAVADIGTGSGAIALALAWHRTDLRVKACDISADALQVAASNAVALGLNGRVELVHADLFDHLPEQSLDAVLSNPPYIEQHDQHLLKGDLRFEPANALTDFSDGLSILRRLIEGATKVLKPNGWLILEHGFDQGAAVQAVLAGTSLAGTTPSGRQAYGSVATHNDLAGQPRMTVARLIGN